MFLGFFLIIFALKKNMHLIKFYKDKITTFVFNETEGIMNEVDINDSCLPLSRYLNKFVDFDEDLTVKDFIKHLTNHKKDVENIFSSYMNNVSMEEIYEECLQTEQFEYEEDINEIEIVWETDLFKDQEIGEYFIHEYTGFIGVYYDDSGYQDDIFIKSMALVPLRNWKDLPISINRFITYQEVNFNEKTKRFLKPKNKLTGIKSINLFDLISGFLHELTVYGNPKMQLGISEKINSRIEEMKNKGEKSFEISISLDELQDEENNVNKNSNTLEKELKKAIEDEDYIRAKKIKDKLDSLRAK